MRMPHRKPELAHANSKKINNKKINNKIIPYTEKKAIKKDGCQHQMPTTRLLLFKNVNPTTI